MNEHYPCRILLVDDDEKLCMLARRMLEKNGYEVVAAGNGEEALRLAESNVPDLIISDLMMPGIDGYELIRRLREEDDFDDCYIIVLTARDTTDDLIKSFELTADDFITKPFHVPELLSRVKAGARLKHMRDRLREANERLAGALRERDTLIRLAMHDLRNPLHVITSYLSLMGQDLIPLETIHQTCERRAQDMLQILDSVLDYAQLETGYVESRRDRVDLSRLLQEGSDLFRPLARQDRVDLALSIEPDLSTRGNERRLWGVVSSLLQGSIHFAAPKTELRVELREITGEITMRLTCLSDTNLNKIRGILDVLHAKREDFPHLEGSTYIGLVLARKVIRSHGGAFLLEIDANERQLCLGFTLARAPDEGQGIDENSITTSAS